MSLMRVLNSGCNEMLHSSGTVIQYRWRLPKIKNGTEGEEKYCTLQHFSLPTANGLGIWDIEESMEDAIVVVAL